MYQPFTSSIRSFGTTIALLLVASPLVSALKTRSATPFTGSSTKVTTVHQFPNGTWLENLTQRPSGSILATELYQPNLWQVDPSKPANQVPTLVTKAPGKMGLYGIVELDDTPEVYAFSAGNLSMTTGGSPFVRGSFSVYSIDLAQRQAPRDFPVIPKKLADFPDAGVLNGMTFLPGSSKYPKGALLSADGITGTIWVLSLDSLKPRVWLRDTLLATCPPGVQGVNGVKYSAVDKRVYFTNTGCGFVGSVKVDQQTGQPAGSPSIAGGRPQGLDSDDFDVSFRKRGTAFVSDLNQNQIYAVDLVTGDTISIAGSVNSLEVAHPTAVKVGRTADDKKKGIIYVTTTGGLPSGINGQIVGGQVLAIKGAYSLTTDQVKGAER